MIDATLSGTRERLKFEKRIHVKHTEYMVQITDIIENSSSG